MTQEIILTTGIYDLIKDYIRRKKVTPEDEEILKMQLKKAKQVKRVDLPLNIVTVDAKVHVKDLAKQQNDVYTFVAPDKAKRKNNTESILSNIGLALVGCKEGDVVNWKFGNEEKELQIIKVERLS